MSDENDLIDQLKQIVGATNVLTDPEDLYVYSFEHFFHKKRFINLASVVRATSQNQLKNVIEIALKGNVGIIRRISPARDSKAQNAPASILIDYVDQPSLSAVSGAKEKEQSSESEQKLTEAGYGSYRNLASALKSFLTNLPAQKCVNCDVCSSYCTVSSSFNGVETWSSKGRTLLTQALFTNELQSSSKLSEVLYSCSLCGLCFAECFETTQVRKAIMQARRRLVERGHMPDLFKSTARNIFETGDPSGMPSSKRVTWTRQLEQKRVFTDEADVLLWSGCIVSIRTPNAVKALSKILGNGEANFTSLGEKEGCCGYVLLASGLWDEAKENAARLVERVGHTRAEVLVTPCAGCYYTFTKLYPEILDLTLPCQVMHASQYVERLVNENRITLSSLDTRVTYHDPCSLGRHCNVYSSPRSLLKAVPGLDFVEMSLNQNRARCCGAGGGLWSYNNSVALNSASERLEKDVAPLGVSALVTACPTCHLNFRFAATKKQIGTKVLDLMEIVESALAPAS